MPTWPNALTLCCAIRPVACAEAGERDLADGVERVAAVLGPGPHGDYNAFVSALDQDEARPKLTSKRVKLVQGAVTETDETALPVIKKVYILHRGNHPDLNYAGGQSPILHLEADLYEVVNWAEGAGWRWAFTLSNAGARYTEFRSSLDQLDQINWPAVSATDFRDPTVKEGTQSEFLVRDFLPWLLVRRIGVHSMAVYQQVMQHLQGARHRPQVEIHREWYY